MSDNPIVTSELTALAARSTRSRPRAMSRFVSTDPVAASNASQIDTRSTGTAGR